MGTFIQNIQWTINELLYAMYGNCFFMRQNVLTRNTKCQYCFNVTHEV